MMKKLHIPQHLPNGLAVYQPMIPPPLIDDIGYQQSSVRNASDRQHDCSGHRDKSQSRINSGKKGKSQNK
jgi:hypothetical protein